jgi:hypothetical protein
VKLEDVIVMAMSRKERVRQPSASSANLVRGPFTTGRVNNNLVSGEPGALHPDLLHKIKNQIKNSADIIVLYDRRKINLDRRKLHTYLANDRRIGIANRRKGSKNIRAEVRSH